VSAELERALPALREAEEALNVLTKKDITELKVGARCIPLHLQQTALCTAHQAACIERAAHRPNPPAEHLPRRARPQAYSKPPALVELTLGGVMTVLRRPPGWDEAKRALGDANFMGKLLNYDKDTLDEGLLKRIAKFTAAPDFTPDAVGKVRAAPAALSCWRLAAAHPTCMALNRRPAPAPRQVSLAARGLCMWVRAMEVYGAVARDVGPKRARLKAAQEHLAKKQAALTEAQEALAGVLAKVATLRRAARQRGQEPRACLS
jgi:dynein heavy chain